MTPTMTKPQTPALKACPFCDGRANFGTTTYSKQSARDVGDGKQQTYHTVNCVSCCAKVGALVGYVTQEAAAEAWNTRTIAQTPHRPEQSA